MKKEKLIEDDYPLVSSRKDKKRDTIIFSAEQLPYDEPGDRRRNIHWVTLKRLGNLNYVVTWGNQQKILGQRVFGRTNDDYDSAFSFYIGKKIAYDAVE